MIFKLKLFLFINFMLNAFYIVASEKDEFKIICYFNSQSANVKGYGQFDIEHIDPTLCTHLVYLFATVHRNGSVVPLNPDLDLPQGRDFYGQVNALKQKHPHLKTLLSVDVGAIMTRNRTQWLTGSSINLLNQYGFDGLNLNWGEADFGAGSILSADAIDQFLTVLKTLKVNYDAYKLELIASIYPPISWSENYDIPTICSNFHLVGLKTFDLHGPWYNFTGHHSALHSVNGEDAVDNVLEYWLRAGCPASKLVMGLSTYGRTFYLTDPNDYEVGAPSSGPHHSEDTKSPAGYLYYYEHSNKLLENSNRWHVYYDEQADVPYSVEPEQRRWVSYDNPESITKKVQYALGKPIAGVLIYTIDSDDFRREPVNYPLLRAVNDALATEFTTHSTTEDVTIETEPIETTTTTDIDTTPTTTTSTTTTSTTAPPAIPGPLCQSEGFAPHPADCTRFILCMRSPLGQLVAYELHCPSTTVLMQSVWDQAGGVCSLPLIDYCAAPTTLQKFMSLSPIREE